jgi:hypothetical protein
MDSGDRELLRSLASQVAEIAADHRQGETIALWKALNGLKPVRPMVMISQIPWHEMDLDAELSLRSESQFCRKLETDFRRTLYAWRHMRADMVVEPVVEIPKIIRGVDFGIRKVEKIAITDPNNEVVGHSYEDLLRSDEDLQKIRMPLVSVDCQATAELEEKAHDLFDGILSVNMQGAFPRFAPWDRIAEWRGAGNVLLDLADRPEFMHRLISRLTDAHLDLLDQLEQENLLGSGQATIHHTGAFSDELPAAGFDPKHPRAKDLWTCGMAQIFSAVSPSMHQEFELDYANRWYERFGLVYYGCCEPLHNKIDIIRAVPHVRKISMSSWVDVEKAAERIGHDFVFSRKPSPALLAEDNWRPEAVEKDLRDTRESCRRHDCPLELILKDISTVRYQPRRLWQWADIAMRVIME